MQNSIITSENKLSVPKKLLTGIYFQLKLNAAAKNFGGSYQGLSDYLIDVYQREFEKENPSLFEKCITADIRITQKTIERAVGKNPSGARYELLDFICFVCKNKKTLAEVIFNEYFSEADFSYAIDIPEYAQRIITDLNNKTLLGDVSNKTEGDIESIPYPNLIENSQYDFEENENALIEQETDRTKTRESIPDKTLNEIPVGRALWKTKYSSKKIFWISVSALVFFLIVTLVALHFGVARNPIQDFTIKLDDAADISLYTRQFFTRGFNDNTTGGQDCPLVSITNDSRPLITNINCMGSQVIRADGEEIISLFIYCHNTGEKTSKNLNVKLRQYVQSKRTIFDVIVLNNITHDTVAGGYAEALYQGNKKLQFCKIVQYKDKDQKGDTLSNGEDIFAESGLDIGNIPGYGDCPIKNGMRDAACHETWVRISFRVVNIFPKTKAIETIENERDISVQGFNDNSINIDCPTVSASVDVYKDQDGCIGSRSLVVDTDRFVNVIFYYHNTKNYTDKDVRLRLELFDDPKSHKMTFKGIILLTSGQVVGYTNVFYSRPKTFILTNATLYADQSTWGVDMRNPQDIFSEHGLSIADIPSCLDCPFVNDIRNGYCHQGWVAVKFLLAVKKPK